MKKTTVLKSILFLLVVISLGCKKQSESKVIDNSELFDMISAKTAIETQGEVFVSAMNKGDSIGLSNCYTKDAKLMLPNEKTVVGRENIQKVFSSWIKAGMPTFAMKTIDVWGNQSEMMAEEEWTFSDKDGKIVDSGKSLELFTMEDGKWKLYRDCYNSDMPPPPPPSLVK